MFEFSACEPKTVEDLLAEGGQQLENMFLRLNTLNETSHSLTTEVNDQFDAFNDNLDKKFDSIEEIIKIKKKKYEKKRY